MDQPIQAAHPRVRRSLRHRLLAGAVAAVALACLGAVPVAAGSGSNSSTQNVNGNVLPTPVPPPTPPPTPTPTPTPPPTPLPTASPTPGPATLPPVSVTAESPTSGPAGSLITVDGSGFSGAGYTVTSVTVDGSPASFTVLDGGTLQFVVPNVPGGPVPVVVTTSNGTDTLSSSPFSFTVTAGTVPSSNPPPTITGIQPTDANPGDTITITGSSPFNSGSNSVTGVLIGGQSVDFTTNGNTISLVIPSNMPPGPVSVVVVFSDGTHSMTKAGLTLTIKAPQKPATVFGTVAATVGAVFSWLGNVATTLPKPLVIGGSIMMLGLLALLVYLMIVAIQRRLHRDEGEADALDFSKNIRF